MPSFFGTATGLIVLAFCLSTVHYADQAISLFHKSRTWSTAPVNLTLLRLDDSFDPNGDGDYTGDFCEARYSYTVDNVTYNGTRISIWSDVDAERYCDFLEVRQEMEPILCYYDPINPTESLLDKRLRPSSLVTVIFVIVSFMYGAMAILTYDGFFKIIPRILTELISFSAALFILLACTKFRRLTENSPAVSIGVCTSLFACFVLHFWLVWESENYDDAGWLSQDATFQEMYWDL